MILSVSLRGRFSGGLVRGEGSSYGSDAPVLVRQLRVTHHRSTARTTMFSRRRTNMLGGGGGGGACGGLLRGLFYPTQVYDTGAVWAGPKTSRTPSR